MNFDHFGCNRKPGPPDFELIDAVRQALKIKLPCSPVARLFRYFCRADDMERLFSRQDRPDRRL